jgi:hypothetical protein
MKLHILYVIWSPCTDTMSTYSQSSNQAVSLFPVQQTQGQPSPAPLNPYCPGQNGATITPYDASGEPIRFNNDEAMSFRMLCNTYWPAKRGINDKIRDIMLMTVPDMLTCISLCAQFNQGYSDSVGDDVRVGGGICVGVSLIRGTAQFCYLKNATGINQVDAADGHPVDSAVLIGDWANMTSEQQTLAFGGILPGH